MHKSDIFATLLATTRQGEAEAAEFGDNAAVDDLEAMQSAANEGDFECSTKPPDGEVLEPGAQSPSSCMAVASDGPKSIADDDDDGGLESDDGALTEAELAGFGGRLTLAETEELSAASTPALRHAYYIKHGGERKVPADSAGTGEAGAEPPSRDLLIKVEETSAATKAAQDRFDWIDVIEFGGWG